MTRDQLEHAIRAACDVSEDTELWIFGSQAILGEFPDAPKSLHSSRFVKNEDATPMFFLRPKSSVGSDIEVDGKYEFKQANFYRSLFHKLPHGLSRLLR